MGTTTRGNEALLVIDMQRDFCEEGVPALRGRRHGLPSAGRGRGQARPSTGTSPSSGSSGSSHASGCDVERFQAGVCTSGGRGPCTRGTAGAELVGPIWRSDRGDHKIVKTRFLGIPSHKPGTPAPGRARRRPRGPGRRAEPQLHSRHGHGRRRPRFPVKSSCSAMQRRPRRRKSRRPTCAIYGTWGAR